MAKRDQRNIARSVDDGTPHLQAINCESGESGIVAGDILCITGVNTKGLWVMKKADSNDGSLPIFPLFIAKTRCDLISNKFDVVPWMQLNNVNTSGAAIGDPVYLSTTAGGWTLTAPAGQQVRVGVVLAVSASVGRIALTPNLATPAGTTVTVAGAVFTAQSAGASGSLALFEATANGTNKVIILTPTTLASDVYLGLPEATLDLQDVVKSLVLRTAKITVSAAEIRALETTAKTLVAAPGAGYFLEPVSVHLWLDFATTAHDDAAADGNLTIGYTDNSGQVVMTVEADTFVDGTADEHRIAYPLKDSSGVQSITPVENAALVLGNDGAAFTGTGDSPIYAEVLYRVRSLTMA